MRKLRMYASHRRRRCAAALVKSWSTGKAVPVLCALDSTAAALGVPNATSAEFPLSLCTVLWNGEWSFKSRVGTCVLSHMGWVGHSRRPAAGCAIAGFGLERSNPLCTLGGRRHRCVSPAPGPPSKWRGCSSTSPSSTHSRCTKHVHESYN